VPEVQIKGINREEIQERIDEKNIRIDKELQE
jgi:hypothetical protein